MDLDKSLLFKINNTNCVFRTINETDVTQEYIDGLKEQNKYIENIPPNVSISRQQDYIKETINSKNNTICGLFLDGELVGTAGIQLSNSEIYVQDSENVINNVATIGIFVFSKSCRGKGLGKTLVWASTYLLHNAIQLEWFFAGMEIDNIPSNKSFLSCGFKNIDNSGKDYKVKIKISDLKKPAFIKKVVI
jgi:RimJ/RimL family protein N-acetyltransferase